MDEVKVTRAHREAVLARVAWPFGEAPEVYRRWAERGMDAINFMSASGSAVYDGCERYEDKARIYAEAEARGRAAERADVVAWLDGVGTQYMEGDMVPCDEFVGEAYHQARDEIRKSKHVGAADV